MAKSKKEVSKKAVKENVLTKVETISERFKDIMGGKELYHTNALLNQSQEPEFPGYSYFGCGDFGFYYVKS